MAERLRRTPRLDPALLGPPHPPLRHRRDRQRKLALQEPSVSPPSPLAETAAQLGGCAALWPATRAKGGQSWTPIGVNLQRRLTARYFLYRACALLPISQIPSVVPFTEQLPRARTRVDARGSLANPEKFTARISQGLATRFRAAFRCRFNRKIQKYRLVLFCSKSGGSGFSGRGVASPGKQGEGF